MKKSNQRIPLAWTAVNEVLPFIKKYQLVNGMPPTQADIAAEFKRTPEWARVCLKALASQKLIKLRKYKVRGIRVI